MTEREKPVEPHPRLIVAEPRGLRTKTPIRWVLRFGLRTVFAVLLLICVALSVAYHSYFRTRSALAGPTLYLHANDTVSLTRKADQPLSDDALAAALEQAMTRYRAAAGETRDEIERVGWASWDNPYGPPVTVVAHLEAKHGALNSLLHACVDHGFERYNLTDATNRERSFLFVLVRDYPRVGLPNPSQLPPVRLRVGAAEDGSLKSLQVNQRKVPSLAELRRYLIWIIGSERGPNSIHDAIEVEMRCDANLKIRHVFDARDAMAGYKTKDGKWVSLVERIRPVNWGTGESDFEDIDVIQYGRDEAARQATSTTTVSIPP